MASSSGTADKEVVKEQLEEHHQFSTPDDGEIEPINPRDGPLTAIDEDTELKEEGKVETVAKTKEETANIFSFLTFSWISEMFKTGYSRTLEFEDLEYLRARDHSQNLLDAFAPRWKQQELKFANDPTGQPSVLRAILSSFGTAYWLAIPLKLVYDLINYAGPVFLELFINASEQKQQKEQFIYAACLFGSYSICTLIVQQFFHNTWLTGMRARGSLLAALYNKCLRINLTNHPEQNAGYLMNVITTDCNKIRDIFQMALGIVSAPIQIVLAVYLLYRQIQWSVFVGIGSQLLIILPLQMKISTKTRQLQRQLSKIRDSRLSIVNEVFNAIKVVKMYAWELSFAEKMTTIRQRELKTLATYYLYMTFNVLFFMFASTFVTLAAFATYSLAGNQLTPAKIFTSLALFNLLRFPLVMIPMMIVGWIEAQVSFKRVRKFLTSPEIDHQQLQYVADVDNETNLSISITNSTFYYDDKSTEVALKNINVEFKQGSMNMIIGRTGSGKTALLRAILGDLNKKSDEGRIVHYESPANPGQRISIGYSSQVAWIQNATVRDNILFGKPYNEEFYKQVIRACALKDDMKIFPNGDQSEIGEKGINLSGGQKQRISLARAVYSKADVFIFDDPLSAVDTHVAQHIFEKCFMKLLRNKTIILSTHSITFLKDAHNIIVMKDSEIQIQGNLTHLQEASIDLAQFDIKKKKKRTDGEDEGEDFVEPQSRRSSFSMTLSSFSASQSKNPEKEEKGKLTKKEERGVGDVGFGVYWLYMSRVGICTFVALMVFNILSIAVDSLTVFWLAIWAQESEDNKGTSEYRGDLYYLGVYVAMIALSAFLMLGGGLSFLRGQLKASQNLHDLLLDSMMKATMTFYDETPFGRIINRFSKDMNDVDGQLPSLLQFVLRLFLFAIAALVRIAVSTWGFAIAVIPVMAVYYYVQRYFISALRELRRLSSIMNSPIYSHFGESLNGAVVIRALHKQKPFQARNRVLIDNDLKCYYPSIAANRWLGIRLESIGNVLLGVAAFSCALTQPTAGLVGVALTSVMSITTLLNFLIRQKSMLEETIVAVERIDQYLDIPKERPFEIAETKPADSWPSRGDIRFSNVYMKYRENLDYILKGLSFEIHGGEKVGVIGRTGAGKSSLFVTLLRMVEIDETKPDSFIEIDDVDIGKIGLRDLRKNISVIPQDPILFTGTIRFNLDPFDERSDEELIQSLKSCHIYPALKRMAIEAEIRKKNEKMEEEEKKSKEGGKEQKEAEQEEEAKYDPPKSEQEEDAQEVKIDIDALEYKDVDVLTYEVETNGSNFSLGQRQLLCMARAIVRNSKIILLDEATSSVDPKTDKLIQGTIREVFNKNTILTIAHRIDTILDYDKILIMESGKILEFDSPANLLNDEESKFVEIVKSSFGVDVHKVFEEYAGKTETVVAPAHDYAD
mmetsp:Transcript_32813/g.52531  ORF Transcript_32813/g.52531 Transcript_32813/m.52531 type:complete len:1421 (+) Transcript_32813:30-4292(+)